MCRGMHVISAQSGVNAAYSIFACILQCNEMSNIYSVVVVNRNIFRYIALRRMAGEGEATLFVNVGTWRDSEVHGRRLGNKNPAGMLVMAFMRKALASKAGIYKIIWLRAAQAVLEIYM